MSEYVLPLFAMTSLFIIPALIGLIAIVLWFRNRKRLYQSIDDAIDKGAPPEVINRLVEMVEKKENKDEEYKTPRKKSISNGCFLLALGIAFIFLYSRGVNQNLIYPAAFCTMLGLAHLCIALFIKDDEPKSE